MPGSAFLRLPTELLFLVAGYLDPWGPRFEKPSDLCNLRLVSKRLSHAALPALVKRYFQHRCIMLQRNSLENLVAISGHPVFGPAVEDLSIRLYHWTSSPERANTSGPPQEGGVKGEDVEEEDVDMVAYHLLMEDQLFMMDSGLTTTYLVQALVALPALKTVSVNEERTPWGVVDLMRKTGLRLNSTFESSESIEFARDAIRAIVRAIILNNTALDELELCPGFAYDHPLSSHLLCFSPPILPLLQTHHARLRTLRLGLGASYGSLDDDMSNFLEFVALFPGLESLWLEFDVNKQCDFFPPLSRRLRLQGLQFLGLDGLDCTASDLLGLLRAHNLQQVALMSVFIEDGDGEGWREVLAAIRDEGLTHMLKIKDCFEGNEWLGYREPGSKGSIDNDIVVASTGVFSGSLDWTTMINGLVIGDGDEEDDEDQESD